MTFYILAGWHVKRSVVRPAVPVRRPRQARSRATRARIVAAASRLFVRDGYVDTTMAAIAAEAGVAVQSLYVGFGGKLGILTAALDAAITGDAEPVPLLERAWAAELAKMADARAALEFFVGQVREILTRTYPLYDVVRAAAATEAGELLRENKRQRYEGVHAVAAHLSTKRGFAASVSVDQAADLLYTLVSEECYGLLVGERGWDPAAWQSWCTTMLTVTLLQK